MSIQKHRQDDLEELERIAIRIALETGVISECENHPGTYIEENLDDIEDAYKKANSEISEGKIKLPSGIKRIDLTDAIKRVAGEALEACSLCQKFFDD